MKAPISYCIMLLKNYLRNKFNKPRNSDKVFEDYVQ